MNYRANESRVKLACTMPNAAGHGRSQKLAESEEDLLEHRTDGTDAFDTLYIGCEKFPFHDSFSLATSGVI